MQIDILALMVVALLFRLWGLGFDLPNLYHPDEYRYVGMALRILKTGDYNLRFFNYPSLFFYIQAFAYAFLFLFMASRGVVKGVEGLMAPVEVINGDVAYTRMPSQLLVGRGVSVLFAVGTVAVLYLIGRKLFNRRVGLLAGLALAVSFTHVRISHFVAPDVHAAFFVTLAVLVNYQIITSGRVQDYILGGVAVGLAATTKYNAGLAIVLLVSAHLLRRDKSSPGVNIVLGLVACGVAFLAGSPFALLDLPTFLNGLAYEIRHYSAPVWPYETGSALLWYVRYLWSSEGLIALLAGIQIARSIVTRCRNGIYLASFSVAYFLFVSSNTVRNDRTLAPILPLFSILSAVLVHDLLEAAVRRTSAGSGPALRTLVVLAVLGAVFVPAISNTVALDHNFTLADVRTGAVAWVEQNLPPGSRITVESYSPIMPETVHRLELVRWATDHSIEWYQQNADYILLYSRNHYATVMRNPGALAQQLAEYDAIIDHSDLVKEFHGPWVGLSPVWVKICRVR